MAGSGGETSPTARRAATASTGGESWLYGGPGDDVFDADDLYVDVTIDGGPGTDQAWYDDDDPVTSVEQRLQP